MLSALYKTADHPRSARTESPWVCMPNSTPLVPRICAFCTPGTGCATPHGITSIHIGRWYGISELRIHTWQRQTPWTTAHGSPQSHKPYPGVGPVSLSDTHNDPVPHITGQKASPTIQAATDSQRLIYDLPATAAAPKSTLGGPP